MRLLAGVGVSLAVVGLAFFMAQATDRSIAVVDGDTVRVAGNTFRIVGFDAPETGSRARCAAERTLGDAAKRRLNRIVDNGATLSAVSCACRPGTEGTRDCNYGRKCAVMKQRGQDVAEIMIGEGLARSYRCGTTSCPPRQGWCG